MTDDLIASFMLSVGLIRISRSYRENALDGNFF